MTLFVITKRAVPDISAFGLELDYVVRCSDNFWVFAVVVDRESSERRLLREEEIAAIVSADVGQEDDVIEFVDHDPALSAYLRGELPLAAAS